MANTWKDLEITRAELDNIQEALKNKEFRKLLVEYCDELTDPASRKKYQEEITQLEKERGVDVTFIDPKPGYVIKTSIDGNKLAFINVCSNENVRKPSSKPTTKDGSVGMNWSLPHLLSPPRDDLNKKGKRCTVFDVIFHPETLILVLKNNNFRDLVNNIACEAVEANHNVKLDKTNVKFPKLQFKGMSRPLVIRKKVGTSNKLDLDDPIDKIYSDIYQQIDENISKTKPQEADVNIPSIKLDYATPNYIVKHRTNLDLQDFTYHITSHENDAIPKELIVEINLPLLKSSSELQLDVTEKTLSLVSEKPSKYKLFLTLPYAVFEDNGSAKFDQDLRKLIVTLPVKRRSLSFEISHDSGVDSDNSPVTSNFNLEDNLPLIEELNIEESKHKKINSECVSEYRTKNVFLDPESHYSLPEYSCHLYNNILVFTLRVKNVEHSSLHKIVTHENSSAHIKFSSLSPAFVPMNFAFYIHLTSHTIDEDNFSTEIWDNNIVVQIPYLTNDVPMSNYWIGTSEESAEEKTVEEPSNIFNKRISKKLLDHAENEHNLQIEVAVNDRANQVEIILNPQRTASSDSKSSDEEINNFKEIQGSKKYSNSYSESSCDELSVSPTKGILKSHSRHSLSRSVSESSADDYTWSSFENYASVSDSLIPEDSEVSSSMKKTVRFNDVVSKQLFR